MTEHSTPIGYRSLLVDRRIASVLAAVTIGRRAAGMVPFGGAGAVVAGPIVGGPAEGPTPGGPEVTA